MDLPALESGRFSTLETGGFSGLTDFEILDDRFSPLTSMGFSAGIGGFSGQTVFVSLLSAT